MHTLYIILASWVTLLLLILGLAFTFRLSDEELLEKELTDYREYKDYDRR